MLFVFLKKRVQLTTSRQSYNHTHTHTQTKTEIKTRRQRVQTAPSRRVESYPVKYSGQMDTRDKSEKEE